MRELECNTALLTMTLISGADVSMPAFELQEDSFNIHRDINQQKHYQHYIFTNLLKNHSQC